MFATLSPKLLGFLTAGVSVPLVGGVVYVAWPTETHTLLLVSADTTSPTQPDAELAFANDKNFKCKFGDKVDENCSIESFEVDATKKWANLSKFNEKATSTTAKATKELLKTANKFFKVSVSSDIVASIDWKSNSSKLDVVPKTPASSDESKKYASLTPLLSFGHKKANAKNNLFLAKAVELLSDATNPLSITSSDSYKCVLGNADVAVADNQKTCTIKTFASSQSNTTETSSYTGINFGGSSSSSSPTTITKNNFYLVEFTEALTAAEMSKTQIFYVDTTSAAGSAAPTKKVKFSQVSQAVLSGASGSENLFILS